MVCLDEHTHECHVLCADRALKLADVSALVKGAIAQHSAPESIRSDNGSEFIAKELQAWLAAEKIKTIYIGPSSPRRNRFVDSSHGRFPNECLNREQLWTLTEARVIIEDYRNQIQHRSPAKQTRLTQSSAYDAQLSRSSAPGGPLRRPRRRKSKGPHPIAQPQLIAGTANGTNPVGGSTKRIPSYASTKINGS